MANGGDKISRGLPLGWCLRGVSAGSVFAITIAVFYPLAVIFYSFVGGGFLKIGLSLAGAAVFFIMLLKRTCVSGMKKKIMVLTVSSMLILGWYGALWTNVKSYGAILTLLSCLGVAWATLEFKIEKYVYEYPFFVFMVLTVFLILAGTDQYEFNRVLAIGSRNVYSAILIAFAVGYLYSRRVRGRKSSVILGASLVGVSFFLYSRTGLALAFGLFFCFFAGSGLATRLRAVFFLFLPGIFLLFLFFDVFGFVVENSNFEKGLDSARFDIWKSYLSSIDVFGFLFGYDVGGSDVIVSYGSNTHSAYFRMHSYFGAGLILLILLPLFSLIKMIKKREWLFIFLFFCFFFRAIFDPVYFVYFFDYVFYPFVFFYFFSSYFYSNGFLVRKETRLPGPGAIFRPS